MARPGDTRDVADDFVTSDSSAPGPSAMCCSVPGCRAGSGWRLAAAVWPVPEHASPRAERPPPQAYAMAAGRSTGSSTRSAWERPPPLVAVAGIDRRNPNTQLEPLALSSRKGDPVDAFDCHGDRGDLNSPAGNVPQSLSAIRNGRKLSNQGESAARAKRADSWDVNLCSRQASDDVAPGRARPLRLLLTKDSLREPVARVLRRL